MRRRRERCCLGVADLNEVGAVAAGEVGGEKVNETTPRLLFDGDCRSGVF